MTTHCEENILYKYPLSSCSCYECKQKPDNSTGGAHPTNMSVTNCDFTNSCTDRKLFRVSKEPVSSVPHYNILNKLGVQPSTHFYKVECKNDHGCPTEQYTARDARLVSAPRGSRLTLDRPPYSGETPLNQIYDEKFRGYGQGYKDYTDVKAGQIMYYVDSSIADALYEPVYDIPAKVDAVMYKDPMGNLRPQFNRIWENTDCHKPPESGCDNYGCLSEISDTSQHREDIISRQQLKNNAMKYSARWGANVK